MKFTLSNANGKVPTNENNVLQFYAGESVRIMPKESSPVSLGVKVEGILPDEFILVHLTDLTALRRPFLIAKGIEVLSATNNTKELKITLYNRSDFPAVVDMGEHIADGIRVNYQTLEKTTQTRKTVNTKKEI